jgi:hypothetical protein
MDPRAACQDGPAAVCQCVLIEQQCVTLLNHLTKCPEIRDRLRVVSDLRLRREAGVGSDFDSRCQTMSDIPDSKPSPPSGPGLYHPPPQPVRRCFVICCRLSQSARRRAPARSIFELSDPGLSRPGPISPLYGQRESPIVQSRLDLFLLSGVQRNKAGRAQVGYMTIDSGSLRFPCFSGFF